MSKFHKEILNKVFISLENEYYDNFDYEIRELSKKVQFKLLIEKFINKVLNKFSDKVSLNILHLNFFYRNIDDFEYLYNLLTDERSKTLYIEILAYKMLGFQKVKLSLNSETFWNMRNQTKLYKKEESLKTNFRTKKLDLYELKQLGFDVDLYFIPNGIVTDFMLEQYRYEDLVKVEAGDVVIDCGGCWGDTALYFAAMGASKVFTFEFIPSNIEIFKKNIALNRQYENIITLVENPVWSKSGVNLSYLDKGPASLVDDFEKFNDKTQTLTIDDLVENFDLLSVDFIKMDIEGAEIPALDGAIKTIKKFKPKLAISAYHKPDDLIEIPKLIKSIRDDYEFYFDYYTIVADEIVLYAI